MTIKEYLDFYSDKAEKSNLSLLLQSVLNIEAKDLILKPELEISKEKADTLVKYTEENINGKPVAYILHERSFFKSKFYVNENVLIPQPDTEILVGNAITYIDKSKKKTCRVLDLCTGSGCIGISIAKEKPECEFIFSDISSKALEVCKMNAENILKDECTYKLVQSDLFEKIKDEKFDLIVSNPPYIESSVIPVLDKEVQNEPHIALDGGSDGLKILKEIIEQAKNYLSEDAEIMLEIGYNQGEAVKKLLSDNGYSEVSVIKDFNKNDRVAQGRICTK